MDNSREDRREYYGSLTDIDIRSLNPKPVEGEKDFFWLHFQQEPQELRSLTESFYFIGNRLPYYDSESKARGQLEIVDTDWKNNRIKVKFFD